LSLDTVQQIVDQAGDLGFQRLFLTGGEPFLLPEIMEMLAYASARIETTVLTNATLLSQLVLKELARLASDNLRFQVSLDGGRPEHHDGYRNQSWSRTVHGLRGLLDHGLRVLISSTITPDNAAHLDELEAFLKSLGIPKEDHLVRPMAKRGFAQEGIEIDADTLVPEVTLAATGVYWHPLVSPSGTDIRVSTDILPLAKAVRSVQERAGLALGRDDKRAAFT
jgi:MoaA/NifB/PqqE/SkfB family radical SAM enzyme